MQFPVPTVFLYRAFTVYVDGHERSDVVRYQRDVFLPEFSEIRLFLVTWNEEGQMVMPCFNL